MIRLLLLFLFTFNLYAVEFKIIARSRSIDGLNIPKSSRFDNVTPVINDRGDIAFNLHMVGKNGLAGIFYQNAQSDKGQIVYSAAEGNYLSDLSLSNNGLIVFYEFNPDEFVALYSFDTNSGSLKKIITPERLPEFWAYSHVEVDDDDNIYFRALGDGGRGILTISGDKIDLLIKEDKFLYAPKINRHGDILFKRDSQVAGELVYIHQGQEYIMDSAVSNFYAIAGLGQILYFKNDQQGVNQLIYRDRTSKRIVAKEGEGEIASFEPFYPAINGWSQAVLRVMNKNKRRTLYYLHLDQLTPLVAEGDLIPSDLGEVKIKFKDGWPGFSGGVDINDRGSILAHFVLTDSFDEKELGEAIYLIKP